MSVSVIIPVFNASSSVRTCLESVISQTCQTWECIVVDDGSADGSGRICDSFAERDSRFKVIHQDNHGVSFARNRGLEMASGEYVAFIDSDDTAAPRYLSAMLQAVGESAADLVVCGMTVLDVNGKVSESSPSCDGSFDLAASSADRFVELERQNLIFAPFVKLYKRALIKESVAVFDESKSYGEDLEFNLKYLKAVSSVSTIAEPLYFYNRRIGGLSAKFRPDMFSSDYAQWKETWDFHTSKGLLTIDAHEFIFQKLWGIVYDGLFLFPRLKDASMAYLKNILRIPEINLLREYAGTFDCAPWIKTCILHRRALFFYLYFRCFYKK